MIRQQNRLLTRVCQVAALNYETRCYSTARSCSASPTHNSLQTFLTHAQSTNLSPTSTVYIGTYYEYLCLSTLRRLSFNLTRTGGRSDRGIDLLGHWTIPSLPFPLRVLVQCKALKAKTGPETIRELEGMFAGAPVGWRGENIVGVLCAKREATKGVREAVRRSAAPVIWIMVEDLGQGRGKVRQMLWNQTVSQLGAEGVGVGVRYLPGAEGKEVEKEVGLTWKGEAWDPHGESLREEG
ncbi:MAG: hypothetical protein L6R42_002780 [Xanthoria sp. 1 TBL-2021]|nr:MAG: hypothetical protein L6R42_002780 [Xanthoria sp. 1 TBL-2021]